MSAPLLSIENLTVGFSTERGPVTAVRGISLSVAAGETLCLVGESGRGKSVTCHAVLGLLPSNGRVTGGAHPVRGPRSCRLIRARIGAPARTRGRHDLSRPADGAQSGP